VRADRPRAAAVTAAARLAAAASPLIALGAAAGAWAAGSAGAGGAIAGAAVAALLVAAAGACGDRLALSAMRARPVSEVEHPELYRLVRELSTAGRLPVPRLYLSPDRPPNSFSVGRHPRRAAICCTGGLLAALDESELRGVLGHELAHVAGRDILPGSVSAALAAVLMAPARLARGRLAAAALLLLAPLAALVVRLSVSRASEYRADAAGAVLSGDPVALARALRKVEVSLAELAPVPGARVAAVGHLMLASPFGPGALSRLFETHPPAAERLRRLEALAGYRR